jgi:hypothetical protein
MSLTNNESEEIPTIFSAPVRDFKIIPSTGDRKIEKNITTMILKQQMP